MLNLEEKIKEGVKKQGISLKTLIQEIEMSEAGFYAMLRNDSIKMNTLRRISDKLQLPLSFFIEDTEKKFSKESKDFADSVIEQMRRQLDELITTNSILVRQNMELQSK